jgi:hypothetical protein
MGKKPKDDDSDSPTETKEKKALSPQDIMAGYLKEKPEYHFNFLKPVIYQVSTGSLMWDIYIDGGLYPGVHRLIGPPESGKSSAALEIMRNFFFVRAQGRGLYVKSEGRLPIQLQERCGLKFVWKAEEWLPGTIFVLESNVYEYIINLITRLIRNPSRDGEFCIIMDSADGLQPEVDVGKDFDQNVKVAGAPLLTKRFLTKLGSELAIRGDICLFLGQYSTNLSLDPYAPAENKTPKQGHGGWGLAHYTNFAFEMLDATGGELIKEHQKLPPGPENKIIGKNVRVRFKKTPNETTGTVISYPLKYKVIGRPSIWKSYEVFDLMLAFGLLKPGTWMDFPAKLREEAMEAIKGADIPERINGRGQFLDWLDTNTTVTDFIYEKLKKTLAVSIGEVQKAEL